MDISSKIITFNHQFNEDDWRFDKMQYILEVPTLSGVSSFNDNNNLKISIKGDRLVNLTRTNGKYVTDLLIELPQGIEEPKDMFKRLSMYPSLLQFKHVLYPQWWKSVLDLCKAGLKCDVDDWNNAWNELKKVIRILYNFEVSCQIVHEETNLLLEICSNIVEKSIFTISNWSQGACSYALSYVHYCLSKEGTNAQLFLDQLLNEGGLSKDDIIKVASTIVIKRPPSEEWILIITCTDQQTYCMHRKVLEHFGLEANDIKIMCVGTFPILFDDMSKYL
jgi:hypothetical protein